MITILTGHTCGPACWEAREDLCRCECGGKNHGILRSANGVRPCRRMKEDGHSYTLIGVSAQGDEASKTLWPKIKAANEAAGRTGPWGYPWRETDKGAPGRCKSASREHRQWPELAHLKDVPPYIGVFTYWLRDNA